MRTPVGWSFGEPASTSEFSGTEREMVASAVQAGVRGVNQLSDRVFFVRHPERKGKVINPKTEPNLAEEWKNIKGRLVLPILEAINSNERGKEALIAGQFTRAIGFFDHARRVSISPAQNRAGATFNLGIASLQLKRFAAAIGYFEVVRSFPGISEQLIAKAEQMFARAKQEYRNAVP
jgi:tetratricopeptide (TPR) repeat protein